MVSGKGKSTKISKKGVMSMETLVVLIVTIFVIGAFVYAVLSGVLGGIFQ